MRPVLGEQRPRGEDARAACDVTRVPGVALPVALQVTALLEAPPAIRVIASERIFSLSHVQPRALSQRKGHAVT